MTSPVGGSLVLITFRVNAFAPLGATALNLVPTNSPAGVPVTTKLETQGGGQLSFRPALTNGADANVDGSVLMTGATHFSIGALSSRVTAGGSVSFTVTALEASNAMAVGYAGTVHLSSTDPLATFSAVNVTLTSGVGTFTVTLKTAGGQTLTATDATTNGGLSGTSGTITVSPNVATHFGVVGTPGTLSAGSTASFSVSALDTFGNTASGYSGTVHFTSTDAQATPPADHTLTSGTGVFNVVLKTVGSRTLTASDPAAPSITAGTSNAIMVTAGVATHFSVSGTPGTLSAGGTASFSVTALDSYSNTASGYGGTVQFTSNDPQVSVFGSTLTSGVGVFGVVLKTVGNRTLTATDTAEQRDHGDEQRLERDAWVVGAFWCERRASERDGGDHGELHGDGAGQLQQHGAELRRHGAVYEQRRPGGVAGQRDPDERGGGVWRGAEDGGRSDGDGDGHGQRDGDGHEQCDHGEQCGGGAVASGRSRDGGVGSGRST